MTQQGLSGAVVRVPENVYYFTNDASAVALLVTQQECIRAATDQEIQYICMGLDASWGSDAPKSSPGGEVLSLVGNQVRSMRRRKDETELARLAMAAACVSYATSAVMASAHVGVTDRELLDAAIAVLPQYQPSGFNFQANIGVGADSADPECQARGVQVHSGDVVLVDLYPQIDGYFGDICRSFVVGKATEAQRRQHAALWNALDATSALLTPGASCSALDSFCRLELERAGFNGDYPHHTGHGLGLSQQESPRITPDSTEVLVAGDVIALEPGIYYDNYGMRVEDVFVVQPEGPPVRLTTTTRELSVCESLQKERQ